MLELEEVLARIRSYRPKELFQAGTERFFQELVGLVAGLCGTHMNSLYLTDPGGERLVLRAAIGLPPEWLESAREIPIGNTVPCGVCGRAAATGQVVVAESLDDPATEGFRERARAAGIESTWSVPLVDSDGHVIGTFATYHGTAKRPTQEQIRIVQEVARTAASILETARLYHAQESAWQLQRRAQHLVQQLVGRTDPQQVFAAIADGLKQLLRVDVVWLSLVDKDGNTQFFQSDGLFAAPPPRVMSAPCRQALETNQTAVHVDFEFPPTMLLVRPVRLGTVVCHPQPVDNGCVITAVGWYQRHRFTEEERQILDLFTKFGAIALQNATRLDVLRSSYFGMVRGLLTALEVRDYETVAHSRRVVTYTLLLLDRIGHTPGRIEEVVLGAALHDVGKIGISDSILLKPGRLTPEEYEVVKTHPVIGYEMLKAPLAQFPIALDMVRHHHERFDGLGYPDGLASRDISLEARLLAVADAFDVMTTDRPYRAARTIEEARMEVAKWRGKQFCPDCADVLLSIEPDVLEAVRRGELDRSPFAALEAAGGVSAPGVLPLWRGW